jgi:hypothetical protein
VDEKKTRSRRTRKSASEHSLRDLLVGIGMLQEFDESAFISQLKITDLREHVSELKAKYGEALVQEITIAPFRALQHLPMAALPAPLPKNAVKEAFALMPYFSTLMYRVSRDHDFLKMAYEDVIPVASLAHL